MGMLTFVFIGEFELTVIKLVHLFILLMRVDQIFLAFVDQWLLRLPASTPSTQPIAAFGKFRTRGSLDSTRFHIGTHSWLFRAGFNNVRVRFLFERNPFDTCLATGLFTATLHNHWFLSGTFHWLPFDFGGRVHGFCDDFDFSFLFLCLRPLLGLCRLLLDNSSRHVVLLIRLGVTTALRFFSFLPLATAVVQLRELYWDFVSVFGVFEVSFISYYTFASISRRRNTRFRLDPVPCTMFHLLDNSSFL